jgi:phosphatidylglycerophosphate synthase
MDPNVITTINIIPSSLALYYLYNQEYVLFILFLIIRLILDCADGHVARKYNKVSDFGDLYDHYLDLFFYVFLIVLLTYKFNIIISIILISIVLMSLQRIKIPIIYDFFDFIEDNTVIMIPLLAIGIIYIQ